MNAGDWIIAAMAVLQALAAVAYALADEPWRAVYWIAATAISISLIMVGR